MTAVSTAPVLGCRHCEPQSNAECSLNAPDSIEIYERQAKRFLAARDTSSVGIRVVERWAASLADGATTIELGSGGGLPVTRTLSSFPLNLHAIEPSPTLAAVFKKRFPDIPLACESVQRSDFFARQFDAAIAIGLIFLLTPDDQAMALQKVAGILRPGGRFLFTAPVEIGEWRDVNTGHLCRSLGRRVYEQSLQDARLQVVNRYQDSGGNHYFDTRKLLVRPAG